MECYEHETSYGDMIEDSAPAPVELDWGMGEASACEESDSGCCFLCAACEDSEGGCGETCVACLCCPCIMGFWIGALVLVGLAQKDDD